MATPIPNNYISLGQNIGSTFQSAVAGAGNAIGGAVTQIPEKRHEEFTRNRTRKLFENFDISKEDYKNEALARYGGSWAPNKIKRFENSINNIQDPTEFANKVLEFETSSLTQKALSEHGINISPPMFGEGTKAWASRVGVQAVRQGLRSLPEGTLPEEVNLYLSDLGFSASVLEGGSTVSKSAEQNLERQRSSQALETGSMAAAEGDGPAESFRTTIGAGGTREEGESAARLAVNEENAKLVRLERALKMNNPKAAKIENTLEWYNARERWAKELTKLTETKNKTPFIKNRIKELNNLISKTDKIIKNIEDAQGITTEAQAGASVDDQAIEQENPRFVQNLNQRLADRAITLDQAKEAFQAKYGFEPEIDKNDRGFFGLRFGPGRGAGRITEFVGNEEEMLRTIFKPDSLKMLISNEIKSGNAQNRDQAIQNLINDPRTTKRLIEAGLIDG